MTARKLLSLFVGAILFFALTALATGQEKGGKKGPPGDRVSGTIQNVNQDGTLDVRSRQDANLVRHVVVSDQTKITRGNTGAAAKSDLKAGVRVICMGKFNEKSQLVASQCSIREGAPK